MPRCDFSTRPLTKSFDFHPYGSQCFGRLSPFSIQRHYASHASHASKEKKSKKTLLYLTALVFAMVGSSYAAVPLYRRFCQATGYGGTVQRREVKLSLCYSFLSFHYFRISFFSVGFSPEQIFVFFRVLKRRLLGMQKMGQ